MSSDDKKLLLLKHTVNMYDKDILVRYGSRKEQSPLVAEAPPFYDRCVYVERREEGRGREILGV